MWLGGERGKDPGPWLICQVFGVVWSGKAKVIPEAVTVKYRHYPN